MNKYYNHIGVTVDEAGKHVGPNREAWLAWDDVFPTGPDRKKHPTRKEILSFIKSTENTGSMHIGVISMVNRLLDVAPEDKP